QVVIFFAIRECRSQPTALRRSQTSMMKKQLFSKRPSLPAQHPRRCHSDPVDSSGLVRRVSTYRLKTSPAKTLASPGYMALPLKAVGRGAVPVLAKNTSRHSEVLVLPKPVHQKLTVIGIKGDICVKVPNH